MQLKHKHLDILIKGILVLTAFILPFIVKLRLVMFRSAVQRLWGSFINTDFFSYYKMIFFLTASFFFFFFFL